MAERSEVMEQEAVRDSSQGYSVGAGAASAEGVPPGFKRTEVGVIPEDWEVQSLAALGQFKNGINKGKQDFGHGFPFVNLMDVFGIPRIFPNTKLGLVNSSLGERETYDMRAGDVLFVRSSVKPEGVGLTTLIPTDFPDTVFSGFLIRFRSNSQLETEFKEHCFWEPSFRRRLVAGSTVSANTNINQEVLKSLQLSFPLKKSEQRAIATALSDADALIESLDRLIAKKRAIKQAAMQQLLTGQTRLPGFTGEWKTKRLGDVGTFYKGQGIRRDDISDEGVPCIRYGEIYTRYGDCVVTPESRIPETVAETAFSLRCGDILFAGSGETAEEIGMCVAYLGEQPAFAGGDIVVLRPNEGVSAYLGRLLNHPTIAQQKARLGQGDAVVHISARNLAQIEVHLPKQEEQTAIANVLSDMDTEIEALERRRDKARQIKQGMMQQLLTGRVRLVEPELPTEAPT